ncbi:unnamed protein product, partial [Discosporangium mesarthrocarpum]
SPHITLSPCPPCLQAKNLQDNLTNVLRSQQERDLMEKDMAPPDRTHRRHERGMGSDRWGWEEIIHEEGQNREAGAGGAYLEVRAVEANKGCFVQTMMESLNWPVGGGAKGLSAGELAPAVPDRSASSAA